jgi:hypothetical protein
MLANEPFAIIGGAGLLGLGIGHRQTTDIDILVPDGKVYQRRSRRAS